jgi:hypothetical protein
MGSCNTVQGIYIASGGDYVANNIVSGVAAIGIQQEHQANSSIIVNNTVFNSEYGISVGNTQDSTSYNNYVANNIVVHNYYGIYEFNMLTGPNYYTDNLVYANTVNWSVNTATPTGSVTADPAFVNYQANGSGDYHLQSTSPAINKGIATNAPSTDFDGVSRPQGGAYDIGAYEYTGTVASVPTGVNNQTAMMLQSVQGILNELVDLMKSL